MPYQAAPHCFAGLKCGTKFLDVFIVLLRRDSSRTSPPAIIATKKSLRIDVICAEPKAITHLQRGSVGIDGSLPLHLRCVKVCTMRVQDMLSSIKVFLILLPLCLVRQTPRQQFSNAIFLKALHVVHELTVGDTRQDTDRR